MTEEQVKNMIIQSERKVLAQIEDLRRKFDEFILHTHNGSDSTRIDINDTKGRYDLSREFKSGRPIL